MAADPKLRADLLKKLGGVTPQRLYQIVAELKKDHGPMSTEDATYVLAHQRGLDLTRYIDDKAAVDRIRGMVPRASERTAVVATPKTAAAVNASPRPTKLIRLGTAGSALDLLLSPTVADEADRMAELYAKLYVLENSIRSLINRVMSNAYGRGWWATNAPAEVRKTVQGRKDKEDKVPWHGKRGAHELYYSDFSDLGKIVQMHWVQFKGILHKQNWVSRLEELEPARNTIAHDNPVSENERKRFEVFLADWTSLIAANKTAIP